MQNNAADLLLCSCDLHKSVQLHVEQTSLVCKMVLHIEEHH